MTNDLRYTTNREWCGYETPRYVARFCGQWLRDPVIWGHRAGHQAPAYETKGEAIAACLSFEARRQVAMEAVA